MTEDNLVGTQIDEYLVEALLGEGGMARVYRGRDVYLQRYVAIKVITPGFRQEQDYSERFEREARAIARLDHPHIVRLYRYGEARGLLYMAMQYIEGMDLGSVLESYRQSDEYIEFPEAIRLIREIGSALDYIHGEGVVHRDVKSSNIMLDKKGRAYLADFGLVLLSDVGTRGEIFGSPHYLAPEQAISSANVVPQSDLYSLGVIAYEMFTGQLPFEAENPLDVAMLHMSQEPAAPVSLRTDLPEALDSVLLKILAKKPEERYASGEEFAAAIEKALKPHKAVPGFVPATRKSVLDRVALNLADRPLPPIPAVTPSPPLSDRPVVDKPAGTPPSSTPEDAQAKVDSPISEPAAPVEGPQPVQPSSAPSTPSIAVPGSKPNRSGLIAVASIIAIIGLCAVIGCLAVLALKPGILPSIFPVAQESTRTPSLPLAVQKTDLAKSQTPSGKLTPSTAPGVLNDSSTPSPIHQTPANQATLAATGQALSNSPTPLPASQPTATHPPEPVVRSIELFIEFCEKDRCLGIVNLGQAVLPLGDLSITGKEIAFSGADWGIPSLPPGGCLVLSTNADKWLPSQADCSPAAAALTMPDNFLKKERELEVSYAGISYGTCKKADKNCVITITLK